VLLVTSVMTLACGMYGTGKWTQPLVMEAILRKRAGGGSGINTSNAKQPGYCGQNNISPLGGQYSYMVRSALAYNNGVGHVSTSSGDIVPDISIMSTGRFMQLNLTHILMPV